MRDGSPTGLFVGLATLDVVHRVERLPSPNEKVTARQQALAAGGPAANAAVTFSALGGKAVLVTALGPSLVAQVIRDELKSTGVSVVDIAPSWAAAAPVSSVMVTDDTGDRAVVGGDATGTMLPPVGVEELVPLLDDVDVVLIDGHHKPIATAIGTLARDRRIPVVIDAGRWKPAMTEVIPHGTDVVTSSDFRTPGAPDSASTAAELSRMGVPIVVTTAGADPVRWRRGEESGVVEMVRIEAVDTLGAGDVFHGAYAFGLAIGLSLEERIRYAGQVAATRCRHVGPRSWLYAIAEIPVR